MSKIKLFLCAIVIACALVSCNKKSDAFMLWGVTECYSDFLFCDYEPVKMTGLRKPSSINDRAAAE